MLTGGSKYSRTAKIKKGEEKLQILDSVLSRLDKLTVIGYGFGDHHVNFRIYNAMARKEDFVVEVIDPALRRPISLLEPFDYDSRVLGAQSGVAEWLDYRTTQRWNVEQMESLKESNKLRSLIKSLVEKTWASVRTG
jgi:hypothetical protein